MKLWNLGIINSYTALLVCYSFTNVKLKIYESVCFKNVYKQSGEHITQYNQSYSVLQILSEVSYSAVFFRKRSNLTQLRMQKTGKRRCLSWNRVCLPDEIPFLSLSQIPTQMWL